MTSKLGATRIPFTKTASPHRAMRRIDLKEPLPVIYSDRISEVYESAELVSLTWLKRDHPTATLRFPSGEERKVPEYEMGRVFIDPGDGLRVFGEIMRLEGERAATVKVFDDQIDALRTKAPRLDAVKIIDDYEKKCVEAIRPTK